MEKTYSGNVVLLTTAGRVVGRVHAHFVAHESANRLAMWDGDIWSATGGPLRLRTGDYKVQFPNGTVAELTVERGFSTLDALHGDRVPVTGWSGGSSPF